jgi:catechol 2,3-dioxygenase-like lactoylglutathione lyase family enzyme
MLKDQHVLPTLPARDLDRARSWYADKLGLTPDEEPPDALLYRTGGDCGFLLFASSGAGLVQHQVAGWRVDDLAAEAGELRRRGVAFEEYDTPELRTVDGIATTPAGRAAWFKDSEGNLLTIMQPD